MRITLIFLGLTIGYLLTSEVVMRQAKVMDKAITKKKLKLSDLAPESGKYRAIKIERVPASAPINPKNIELVILGKTLQ